MVNATHLKYRFETIRRFVYNLSFITCLHHFRSTKVVGKLFAGFSDVNPFINDIDAFLFEVGTDKVRNMDRVRWYSLTFVCVCYCVHIYGIVFTRLCSFVRSGGGCTKMHAHFFSLTFDFLPINFTYRCIYLSFA